MAHTIVVTSEADNGTPSAVEGIPHALRVVRQELRRLYRMEGNYNIHVTVLARSLESGKYITADNSKTPKKTKVSE